MPVSDGLPMPERRRHVPPRDTTPGPPQHPVEHHPVIRPPPTPTRSLIGQQRFQPGPFLIGQIMTMQHEKDLPHPTLMIRGTRSNPGQEGQRVRVSVEAGEQRCSALAGNTASRIQLSPLPRPNRALGRGEQQPRAGHAHHVNAFRGARSDAPPRPAPPATGPRRSPSRLWGPALTGSGEVLPAGGNGLGGGARSVDRCRGLWLHEPVERSAALACYVIGLARCAGRQASTANAGSYILSVCTSS
jgi:hypothetical protein